MNVTHMETHSLCMICVFFHDSFELLASIDMLCSATRTWFSFLKKIIGTISEVMKEALLSQTRGQAQS